MHDFMHMTRTSYNCIVHIHIQWWRIDCICVHKQFFSSNWLAFLMKKVATERKKLWTFVYYSHYVFFFSFLPVPFVGEKKYWALLCCFFLRSICKLHVFRCSISYKSFLSVQETQLIVDHETYECWIKSG